MPRERIILVIILIITAAAAAIVLLQESAFSLRFPANGNIAVMRQDIAEYTRVIEEAQNQILTAGEQLEVEEEIRELEASFFPERYREHPGEFGKIIERMAKGSGLHITGIQAVSTGFQFVTEGNISASLGFLRKMEEYQHKISTPLCSLSYTREGTWRLTVQSFPVFLKTGDIFQNGTVQEEGTK